MMDTMLGISYNLLCRWKKVFLAARSFEFASLKLELKGLQEENAGLAIGCEIFECASYSI